MTRIFAPDQNGPPLTPAEDFGDKVQAHTQYRLQDGTLVPGVTTVLNVLNKPDLVPWANRLGRQGIDTRKYKDEAAAIGTLAHYLIQCQLSEEVPDTSDYSANQIARAQRSLRSFQAFVGGRKLDVHHLEKPMVSERYWYGGTIDFAGRLNGKRALIDFKSSKGIYPNHRTQVSAYHHMVVERGYELDEVWVLQIPRTDDERFTADLLSSWELQQRFQMFLACLKIHRLKKELKD